MILIKPPPMEHSIKITSRPAGCERRVRGDIFGTHCKVDQRAVRRAVTSRKLHCRADADIIRVRAGDRGGVTSACFARAARGFRGTGLDWSHLVIIKIVFI